LVVYKGANYPLQESIALVVVGGTAPYTYAFTVGGTLQQNVVGAVALDSPPGITINSNTGVITFDPTSTNATPGRWKVGITVTDNASASTTTDIYITVDGPAGSSAPPPAPALTMPAPTSTNNSAGVSGTGPYFITGYTQLMINVGTIDTIQFNPTASISGGTWVITATVSTSTGGTSSITMPTIPTSNSGTLNSVSYNSSMGQLYLSSGDANYPPGSTVVFTAVCTRTSDGAVGTTLLNVAMPLTEIVPTLVMNQSDTSITLDSSQISSGIYIYTVGDNASIQSASPGSQYITVAAVPAAAGYNIHVSVASVSGHEASWNSTSSQIDITTNTNIGTSNMLGKGFTFTYEDSVGAKMPIGIHTASTIDTLIVNVYDNY
jgi:hypothetical protein